MKVQAYEVYKNTFIHILVNLLKELHNIGEAGLPVAHFPLPILYLNMVINSLSNSIFYSFTWKRHLINWIVIS